MRVSSYNPQSRYRRRSSARMMAFITMMVILVMSFGIGIWLGKQNAGHLERTLQKKVDVLEDERETLQDSVTEALAEAQTAQTRYDQLQETYEEILPEGPLRDLTALLKVQLDEGKSPERLRFLIRSARPPRGCTEPETKRFVVMSPAYDGPQSKIALAGGALVITGLGKSAVSNGRPEAWYDPSKAVKIAFSGADGVKKVKSGALPLRHSMVVNNREYRITIAEGARSFAKATFDSCDYP